MAPLKTTLGKEKKKKGKKKIFKQQEQKTRKHDDPEFVSTPMQVNSAWVLRYKERLRAAEQYPRLRSMWKYNVWNEVPGTISNHSSNSPVFRESMLRNYPIAVLLL